MRTYDELKAELQEISKIVEKFPGEVKPKVYDLLVSYFLGGRVPASPPPAGDLTPAPIIERKELNKKKITKAAVSKIASKESYSIDKNLNLRGDENVPS